MKIIFDSKKRNKKKIAKRFSKKVMIFSFGFLTLYVIGSFILSAYIQTPLDSALTTCVFTYFGVEGLCNAWIKTSELKHKKEAPMDNTEKSDIQPPDSASTN